MSKSKKAVEEIDEQVAIVVKEEAPLIKIDEMFVTKIEEAMSYILEDRSRATEMFEEMRSQWVSGNSTGPMMRELNIALGHSQEPTKLLVELASIMARLKSAESKIQINQQYNTPEPLDQTIVIEQVDELLKEKEKKK